MTEEQFMGGSPHPKAAFMGEAVHIDAVYGKGRRAQVASRCDLYPDVVTAQTFESVTSELADIQVLWSTWGMLCLSPAHLEVLPALQLVLYAAGSVQNFARPLLERGVTVVSAWQANAVPVAEFTVAQVLLACKGYFRNVYGGGHIPSKGDFDTRFRGRGAFGETVALLGAGAIGRLVIELLRPFHLRVAVFDPFLSEDDAAALGVEKVTLAEAFTQGYVVSNHLANNAQTLGLLNETLFASMRPEATFINTGRGATVQEDELARVLISRPDVTALLDVTFPEPPSASSPLLSLPNIHLTTHIAGTAGDELVRMADYVLAEFDRWQQGEPLHYAVTRPMLETMA